MNDVYNIVFTLGIVFFIVIMAILARMAGGGMGAVLLTKYKLKFLPELLFAIPFGAPLYYGLSTYSKISPIIYITCIMWSYLWMQTGHGSILNWGNNPSYTKNRKQFLTPIINKLSKFLNIKIGSTNYARLFMAVKGFLIGLPVGGLILAILWPISYEIGHRLKKHEISELLAGASAAISIIIFSIIILR